MVAAKFNFFLAILVLLCFASLALQQVAVFRALGRMDRQGSSSSPEANTPHKRHDRSSVAQRPDSRINRRIDIFGLLDECNGGRQSLDSLQEKLAALDPDTLDRLIRECATLNVSLEEKANLLTELATAMAVQDPARTVETTIEAIPSGPDFWTLVKRTNIKRPFSLWMQSDLAGALDWFQENQTKKLHTADDSYHHELAILRNPLVNALILTQAPELREFLLAVPDVERGFLAISLPGPRECAVSDEATGADPMDLLPAYLPIIREYLPAGHHPYAFKRLTYALLCHRQSDGLADVRRFFSEVQLFPEEAECIASELSGCLLGLGAELNTEGLSDHAFRELEEWLESEFPDKVESIMEQARNKALATETETARWVISHLKSSNTTEGWPDEKKADELTKYSMKTQLDEALKVAETIKNPELRATVIDFLKQQQPVPSE